MIMVGIIISLGILIIALLLRFVLFSLMHIDITNSVLFSGLVVLLLIDKEWNSQVKLFLFIVFAVIGVILQHTTKILRMVYSIISVLFLGSIAYGWTNYDTVAKQLISTALFVCIGIYLNWISCSETI